MLVLDMSRGMKYDQLGTREIELSETFPWSRTEADVLMQFILRHELFITPVIFPLNYGKSDFGFNKICPTYSGR